MKSQILVKRYTQGLINSLRSEAEFSTLSQELSDFSELLGRHKELKETLDMPFLPASRRKRITEEVLARKTLAKKARRFILLLLENNRLELLPDILESLPEAWNEKKGIYTYEVASVVPLRDGQKKELGRKLELLEQKPVILKYRIDPELVGGLWIRRGNVVYDASIKGSLMKIKETIVEG